MTLPKLSPRTLLAAMALSSAVIASPALADGNVVCHAGPQDKWTDINQLKKKVWMEGWKLLKLQVEGDCYEVYARNSAGQVLEAFFHPVTLDKLVVYRRGAEIYRRKGFTGQ
ncbi:PepSY domain-containing protein [Novosphingobium sp. YJ-S2-02]|uniref:PepSY domain-containing protein n=1 Tax=Novosphingobium aureum TaxID=2792964 RepID=A0A931MLF1_9SPHN|nr:PepSY domain-containing protein [Novosphingobium aureum]MBH0113409.1 PepSY domain-containing protein [Novosphingobium aureum]